MASEAGTSLAADIEGPSGSPADATSASWVSRREEEVPAEEAPAVTELSIRDL